MILVVESTDGGRLEIPLEAGRGDGIAVEQAPDFFEPLPLARLTGLELQQHDENPVLTASIETNMMRPYMLSPSSRIHVGWEDASAPILSNAQRSASFVVGELANVSLDFDRVAAGHAGGER
jgi:hypothetical protein